MTNEQENEPMYSSELMTGGLRCHIEEPESFEAYSRTQTSFCKQGLLNALFRSRGLGISRLVSASLQPAR